MMRGKGLSLLLPGGWRAARNRTLRASDEDSTNIPARCGAPPGFALPGRNCALALAPAKPMLG